MPLIVGGLALTFTIVSLLNEMFRDPQHMIDISIAAAAEKGIEKKIHMDIDSGTDDMDDKLVLQRAAIFFGWLLAFMASMWLIGLIPTVPIFVVALMRLEGNEPWKLVIPQAVGLTVFIYVVFDQLLTIPWPPTLLGTWFPALKTLIPSI